jgi:hypothetical protein
MILDPKGQPLRRPLGFRPQPYRLDGSERDAVGSLSFPKTEGIPEWRVPGEKQSHLPPHGGNS